MEIQTYQSESQRIFHPDVAERFSRSLMEYRRATGQDANKERIKSYLRQNSRGWVWAGITAGLGMLLLLVRRSQVAHA